MSHSVWTLHCNLDFRIICLPRTPLIVKLWLLRRYSAFLPFYLPEPLSISQRYFLAVRSQVPHGVLYCVVFLRPVLSSIKWSRCCIDKTFPFWASQAWPHTSHLSGPGMAWWRRELICAIATGVTSRGSPSEVLNSPRGEPLLFTSVVGWESHNVRRTEQAE
jgi:hypothetical protein